MAAPSEPRQLYVLNALVLDSISGLGLHEPPCLWVLAVFEPTLFAGLCQTLSCAPVTAIHLQPMTMGRKIKVHATVGKLHVSLSWLRIYSRWRWNNRQVSRADLFCFDHFNSWVFSVLTYPKLHAMVSNRGVREITALETYSGSRWGVL
jgi:hypothetical protein